MLLYERLIYLQKAFSLSGKWRITCSEYGEDLHIASARLLLTSHMKPELKFMPIYTKKVRIFR